MTSTQAPSATGYPETPTVSPCCCCPMTYREFYSFINISDIIGCIIGLIITLILMIFKISVSLLAIIITVVWLVTAIVAICIFKSKKSFRTGVHKFYSILRGIICILDIIFMVLLLAYVTFGRIHDVLRPFRILLIILVILLIIMSIFNVYWSALFFEAVFSSKKGSPTTSELTDGDSQTLENESDLNDKKNSEDINHSVPQVN